MSSPGNRREHELRALVAGARWGAADAAVVDATAARLIDCDGRTWVQEWTARGGDVWVEARSRECAAAYLQAASYYAAALPFIDESDGLVEEDRLGERQRVCWDRAAGLLGGESLSIAYEETALPGTFFSAGRGRRPLVVIDHGGPVRSAAAWAAAQAAAASRGFHWMIFDGPGRGAAALRQGLVLRADWESVLGPVVEAMVSRSDVDGDRIAIIGMEHAACGVARALAFEPRFAAAVLAPGIVDVARPWLAELPALARAAVLDEDRDAFNRELELASLFTPRLPERLRRLGREYHASDLELYDLAQRISAFRLGDELGSITTPVLACASAGTRRWSGQTRELCARVPGAEAVCSEAWDEDVGAWLSRRLASSSRCL